VEAWLGQGAYGAVFRAVRKGQEQAGSVALKLAVHPGDERMVREARLLSRLDHPCIPRLLDHGVLPRPDGTQHPWLAMEWIDGAPLYSWTQQHSPSHIEVCLLLAQVARALQALHAAGAVHRDVKGDNVLVRLSDRRPFLLDFGSAYLQGEPRLTWQVLAPFTPGYLSPQAVLFDLNRARQHDAYYAPAPADDLYALGVTAYRLVTGQYPPEKRSQQDREGHWRVECPDVRPLLDNHPWVQPVLREWILRLLSQEPEARGSAALLAQALEAEAAELMKAPPRARAPVSEPPPRVVPAAEAPRRSRAPKQPRPLRPWLVLGAAAGVAMVLWSQSLPPSVFTEHASASAPEQAQAPDAGTAAVGENAPTAPASAPPPSREQPLSQEAPPTPSPGQPRRQARPDANGRCHGPKQVALNGFCWLELSSLAAEECSTAGGYMFLEGKCYGPALELPRKTIPTSAPGEAR
jgi:serine/threonine protein kinase